MIHQIHHNRDKNSHHGQKIGNKDIHHEGKKNRDHKHPQINLHMEIERANHRDVGTGTQKIHEHIHIAIGKKLRT